MDELFHTTVDLAFPGDEDFFSNGVFFLEPRLPEVKKKDHREGLAVGDRDFVDPSRTPSHETDAAAGNYGNDRSIRSGGQ